MNLQKTIPAAFTAQSAAQRQVDQERILACRVRSCAVWMTVAFCGCIFFSGWAFLSGSAPQALYPLDTINPNTAPVESLVRLPGIGPARAMAMVDYRQTHFGTGPAFRTPQDLDAIAGLGPKTIEKMMPWISFDGPGHF